MSYNSGFLEKESILATSIECRLRKNGRGEQLPAGYN